MSEAAAPTRLFVFGCGYSATRFVEATRARLDVVGLTTRSPQSGPVLLQSWPCFRFDGETQPAPELRQALETATHLLISAPPDEAGDPVLRWFADALRQGLPDLAWIGYLSTIGVYGDHGGAWIDETTEPRPVSTRSKARLEAEHAWRALANERAVPLAILRLAGIYGPGRNAFVQLARGTARRLIKPGQVFNRIHVDDIAGALALLMERRADGIFNGTDDEPCAPELVVEEAARLARVEPPPAVPFEAADLSPMARSFYGEVKRVSNAKLKAAGYRFRYPTYREGLEGLNPALQDFGTT
ncbi:SDR family NAD(P)-dependent oxidoreductase [Consotaella aegiceratis]|uniref:SDR family NAD(P)-dependent oxidoreductase n=1 Tax=Consotaella aegiceratis TaxID=3097961 RepID=UPI002F3E491D